MWWTVIKGLLSAFSVGKLVAIGALGLSLAGVAWGFVHSYQSRGERITQLSTEKAFTEAELAGKNLILERKETEIAKMSDIAKDREERAAQAIDDQEEAWKKMGEYQDTIAALRAANAGELSESDEEYIECADVAVPDSLY